VYESGTKGMMLNTGHRFDIATLPAIVLLKLIAYDDNPEQRAKDPGDIADIIDNFFELQPELIYSEEHLDLFTDQKDNETLQEISATVIGREIKKIVSSNEPLTERLKQILQSHIGQSDESIFVKNMVAESGGTVENSVELLRNILSALNS
jgi:predicted nucleotidyltransferase